MKASEITEFGPAVGIETPNSDCLCTLSKQEYLDRFIVEYGDVDVVKLSAGKVYHVPAFAKGRNEFKRAKLAYCEQYGSDD